MNPATGEILSYRSRAALRAATKANPELRSREYQARIARQPNVTRAQARGHGHDIVRATVQRSHRRGHVKGSGKQVLGVGNVRGGITNITKADLRRLIERAPDGRIVIAVHAHYENYGFEGSSYTGWASTVWRGKATALMVIDRASSLEDALLRLDIDRGLQPGSVTGLQVTRAHEQ